MKTFRGAMAAGSFSPLPRRRFELKTVVAFFVRRIVPSAGKKSSAPFHLW
jgi:hypothetical protein